MNKKEYIEKADKNLLHVYNRFPVIFDYGKGVYLYDELDEKYLDFASGIGVMAFGYGNEDFENAVEEMISQG